MLFVVIPASGKSQRMGRSKLDLPLGESTVLEHVVESFQQIRADAVVIAMAPHVHHLAALAKRSGSHALLLPHETSDMRATVLHGLQWLEDTFQPTDSDLWFLVPGDHPTFSSDVVSQLVTTAEEDQDHSIFVPTWQETRGHPTLLQWSEVEGIRGLAGNQGINAHIRNHSEVVLEVPVNDPEVLVDVDDPEAYARLQNRMRKQQD